MKLAHNSTSQLYKYLSFGGTLSHFHRPHSGAPPLDPAGPQPPAVCRATFQTVPAPMGNMLLSQTSFVNTDR